MYELNRVRLFGIGPRGARFTDVTLDLSGVGQPTGTGSLFEAPPRRPSPYSLLMLENGGGKSVLLKLIFSVMLPGKRNTLGGSSGVLEKFVIGDDPGHVVLEWMHVKTGARIITGKAYQWRRDSRGKHDSRLGEAWWSLRPGPTIELTSLPFTSDGRRLKLNGFQEALQEADRTHPAIQLSWTGSNQGEWTDHLRSLGLEPDLFAIQRRMNADEGDAARAFTFKSSKEFIDWLLTVVLDPQDAASVAGNFDSYATTVGDRTAMLLERDFTEGTVAVLQPVGQAHTAAVRARSRLGEAEQAVRDLAQALTARHGAEEDSARELVENHGQAVALAGARETDRDRARDTVNEIRRQTLTLALRDAEKQQGDIKAALDDVELQLLGWAASEAVEARNQAAADAKALAARIADAEENARPALDARDGAAAQLLAKLHHEATQARTAADTLDRKVEELKKVAAAWDKKRDEAVRAETKADGDRRTALGKVADSDRQIEDAECSGVLARGVEVATALAASRQLAERLAGELSTLETESAQVTGDLNAARIHTHEVRGKLADARNTHQSLVAELQGLTEHAERFAADEDIQAALGDTAIDTMTIDASAEGLLHRLGDDRDTRQERLDTLRSGQRDDQHLLTALGDGGLLPARPGVDATVDALNTAGIAAHAGWRYLAHNASARERQALIAAHPDLADGVVLLDPEQLGRAHEILDTERLLPTAAIAVGSAAVLLTAVEAADDRFVVEPNPAMFDEDAAEACRLELRDAMAARGQEIAELSEHQDRIRDLLADLQAWRRTCPPGRLAELAERVSKAETDVTAVSERFQKAWEAEEALQIREAAYPARLTELRGHERSAADTCGALERLAVTVEQASAAQRTADELEPVIAAAQEAVEEAVAARDSALDDAERAARDAEGARSHFFFKQKTAYEIATTSGEVAPVVPPQSLSALRQTYLAADAAYRAVEVGADLRAEAERAARDAARHRSDVERLPAEVITLAEQLLATPAGAESAGRQLQIARAGREKSRLSRDLGNAGEEVGRLGSECRAASPEGDRNVWITLPSDRRPTSVAQGRDLLEAAQADQRQAQDALDTATRSAQDLERLSQQASEAARAFREVLAPLQSTLEDIPHRTTAAGESTAAPEPYAHTIEAAQEHSETVRLTLRKARTEESAASKKLNELVDTAVGFVSEPRFEDTTAIVRRAIIGLGREQLGARAAEFADQLTQRLITLNTDLDNATKHRKLITERLAALTDGALKTLRTASRLSRLPAGLGDWQGKEFLRIRFTDPDPGLLNARIGELVDEIAATAPLRAAVPRNSSKRDGLTLLLRSVEAAVPKGFTVEILKPDSVLRDERVSVEHMNDVFSGGQELTAAIILYCTMAALRANERGQMRSRHSGVLFLDNPIGKASATYLLDLQQGAATALGVQLVYTTGLADDRALSAFPLWIRMRNDADLRAGLKHIRVDQTVRTLLPDPYDEPDAAQPHEHPHGTVTASRVHRRPAGTP
nr:hypothetical protein [Streptacidiphilus neutrinimicus]